MIPSHREKDGRALVLLLIAFCAHGSSEQVLEFEPRKNSDVSEKAVCRIENLNKTADLFRKSTFFEDEPVFRTCVIAVIHDTGCDSRSYVWEEWVGGVECKGQKVSVARIVIAELVTEIGQRTVVVAASEQ